MKLFSGNQSLVDRCCFRRGDVDDVADRSEGNLPASGALFAACVCPGERVGRTTSSGSREIFNATRSEFPRSKKSESASSSSLMLIKLRTLAWAIGLNAGRSADLERPSKRAKAAERLILRTRVETDDVVECRCVSG